MIENGTPVDRAESRMAKADAAIDAKALGALAGVAGVNAKPPKEFRSAMFMMSDVDEVIGTALRLSEQYQSQNEFWELLRSAVADECHRTQDEEEV